MKFFRQNSRRLWLSFSISIFLTFYSFGGIVMAYWVAGVPGNAPEHIRLNFLFWVPITITFFIIDGIFIYWLILFYKNAKR